MHVVAVVGVVALALSCRSPKRLERIFLKSLHIYNLHNVYKNF